MKIQHLIPILFLAAICTVSAQTNTPTTSAPASDLSSPSQETRDAAAKILRSSHAAPSGPNWEAIVGTITNGMTKMSVGELLSPFQVTVHHRGRSDWDDAEEYRLNDAWVLSCSFSPKSQTILSKKLSPSVREVWVEPPTNFTGIWTVYYVNGQKFRELQYDNGKLHGERNDFDFDGSRELALHYNHGILEGLNTRYYAGHTNYSGVYKQGKPFGIWVWYKEDGTVNQTIDYSK